MIFEPRVLSLLKEYYPTLNELVGNLRANCTDDEVIQCNTIEGTITIRFK